MDAEDGTSHPPPTARKTLMDMSQHYLRKAREKAADKLVIIEAVNLGIAIFIFLVKFIDILILLGAWRGPLVWQFMFYAIWYAVRDRETYYPQKIPPREYETFPLPSAILVGVDFLGFLIYLIGSILLFLSVAQKKSGINTKKMFAKVYTISAWICAVFALLPKWVLWSYYGHFVQSGQMLVVCRGPPLLLWAPAAESGPTTTTSAQSLPMNLKKVMDIREQQICGRYFAAIKDSYTFCSCGYLSRGGVISLFYLTILLLFMVILVGIMNARWYISSLEELRPKKPVVMPSQNSPAVAKPEAAAPEPVANTS